MIRLIPKFIVLMAAFFVISGISTYFTVSFFIKNEKTVIVPDFVGEDIIYVLERLTNLGLNAKVKGSEYNPDFAKNKIIYQDPAPGQVIKQGRDVRIIISKGTKILSMPNLKGLSLQQARLIIEKNGLFEGDIAKTFHSKIKQDKIIAQYPLPGSETFRGTYSNLLISVGARPLEFVMPDLKGLFLDEAVLKAEQNHLVIDTIKMVYQKNATPNIILNQEPPPGYHVNESHLINLEVNHKTDKGHMDSSSGDKKINLFRYRLPPGFLKHHIRIELRAFDTILTIYDDLMKPERDIWVVVPAYSVCVIFLYKNGSLVLSKIYD